MNLRMAQNAAMFKQSTQAIDMTPLKKARLTKGWKLTEVVARLAQVGEITDTGNLSRLERGMQGATPQLAESLSKVFGKRTLTEIHVLYPERFTNQSAA
jgi:hypothetical protein